MYIKIKDYFYAKTGITSCMATCIILISNKYSNASLKIKINQF